MSFADYILYVLEWKYELSGNIPAHPVDPVMPVWRLGIIFKIF